MKKFQMQADIEFTASDIDDAFYKLARHFTVLFNGGDSEFEFLGELNIHRTIGKLEISGPE